MTEELLLVLAATANNDRVYLEGQRETQLLAFPLPKKQGADQTERLWGGHTGYREGIKGLLALAT